MRHTILLHLILALGAVCYQASYAEDAKTSMNRVLAAPAFPDSFDDRSWDEGELKTDLGPAKFQDMIAERKDMTLGLRRFKSPAKIWQLKTPKEMLDDARDHMLQGDKDMKLESEKDFQIDGFPGRTFLFTRKGEETVTRMDYFLLKPDLFIFHYSGPKAGLETDDVKNFFKGIKTMETKPAPTAKGEQAGTEQPAARPESKSQGSEQPEPESKGHSR